MRTPPFRATAAPNGHGIAIALSAALALGLPLAPTGRAAIVTSTWTNPVSGSWNVDANWTNVPAQGGFPNNGNGGVATYQSDIIAAGTAAYTVTLNTSVTVERLVLNSANATLSHTGGTLTATNGISLGSGTLNVNGGTLSNTAFTATGGTVSFGSSNSSALDSVSGLNVLRFITAGSRTKIMGGTTFNTARLGGNGSGVGFATGQTLNGTILFEGAAGGSRLVEMNGSAGTLAIGSSGIVRSATGFGGSGVIGGSLLYGGTMTLTNAGLISSQVSGRSININPSSLTNSGTIEAVNGGLVVVNSATWTNTGVLKATNGGFLTLGGSITRADLGAFDANGGTINVSGTLDNSGGTLNLTAASGSLTLAGTIKNGVILGSGGAGLFTASSALAATLDGVDLQADLTMGPSSTLIAKNGVTLGNNAKVTIASVGVQTTFRFPSGVQTLSGSGEIVFGGSTSANFLQAQGDGTAPGASTLTLAPGIRVHGPQSGTIQTVYGFDNIINQGTIDADTAGQSISIRGNFVNNGTVSASGGMAVLSDSWTNAGGNFRASNGGIIELRGAYTRPMLGAFDSNGGSIRLAGTLDLSGSVLELTPATGSLDFHGGVIKDGLVTGSGGAGLRSKMFGGSLDGVALSANVSLEAGGLGFKNGLTLNNVTVTLAGTSSNPANFGSSGGTQTLGGTGEILFTGIGGGNGNAFTATGSSQLTIGPGITIRGTEGGRINASGTPDFIVNQGSIIANTNTKSITILGNWRNEGTLRATNGGILNLGGAFSLSDTGTFDSNGGTINVTGNLNNTRKTLNLTPATGSLTLDGFGTITGGTVASSGSAGLVFAGAGAGITFDGVTLATDISLPAGSTLAVRNGLTLNAGAKVTLGGFASRLTFGSGAQTLGGAGEVFLSGADSNSWIQVFGDASGAGAAVLTIGPGIVIHGTQGGLIQSAFATDKIINTGTVVADATGKTITILGNFTQAGTLEAKNGGALSIAAGYTQTAGVTRLNGGSLTLGTSGVISLQGGLLEGNGTVNGDVNNSAVIAPGLSTGALTIARDLTLAPSSELQFEIGGPVQGVSYDFLGEGGTSPLNPDGTLSVKVTDGFDPAGLAFTILTSSINFGSGTFVNVAPGGRLATTDGSGSFQVDYGPTGPSIVLSNFAVPEPGTAVLCMAALPFLLGMRRRKPSGKQR